MTEEKYRPNVGILLINDKNQVLLGKRNNKYGEVFQYMWQMPQGGIDPGEDIETAAKRELFEETSVKTAHLCHIIPKKYRYDFPASVLEREGYDFKGQEQTWVIMRFLGKDSEIDVENAPDNEFSDWTWSKPEDIFDLVVPFKREVYNLVLRALKAWLKEKSDS
jgi:putative (di)nucleoside polyphosphate hydrolase